MAYLACLFFLMLLIIGMKRKYWSISIYLVSLYLFSVICSIPLIEANSNLKINLIPTLVFCFTLLFYFLPFYKTKPIIVFNNNIGFIQRFMIVGYLFSGILLLGFILLLRKITQSLSYGLLAMRLSLASNMPLLSFTPLEKIGYAILDYFGGLSYTMLLMFFYAITFIKGKRIFKIMLFLSSFSAIYKSLTYGGRTTVIYWCLFIIFCVLIFFRYMSKKNKRIIIYVSIFSLIMISFLFFSISIKRAKYMNYNLIDFLLSYSGQTYPNFCIFFEKCKFHPYTLRRILPLITSIFLGRLDLMQYRNIIYNNNFMDIGIFYSMLGDFYVDLGFVGMLIISILFFMLSSYLMRNKYFNLSHLLYLGILYNIPLFGLFYYSYWHITSSISIMTTILIILFLKSKIFLKNSIIKFNIKDLYVKK